MNSSNNFSSGLIDYDSKCENNLDISPLHPFIYHFNKDFTILGPPPPPPPPPPKKGKNKTRNLHNHCLPFLLDDYPGEIENNGYVFLGGGEINKVHFGLCENGEQTFLPSLTFVLTVAF